MGQPRLRRGDLITGTLAGDYGKPRPCLVVQSDRLIDLDSVVVCPLTSDITTAGPARLVIAADDTSGLNVDSVIMVDKVTAISRSRCRAIMGKASDATMEQLSGLLMLVLGVLD